MALTEGFCDLLLYIPWIIFMVHDLLQHVYGLYGYYGSVEISPVELVLTQELRSVLAETILATNTNE